LEGKEDREVVDSKFVPTDPRSLCLAVPFYALYLDEETRLNPQLFNPPTISNYFDLSDETF
jgi:hypothetical protein